MKRRDRPQLTRPIDVVEAAYDLESDEQKWLARVLRAVMPDLDLGRGATAHIARMTPSGWLRSPPVASGALRERLAAVASLNAGAPPAIWEALFAEVAVFVSVTEQLRRNAPRALGPAKLLAQEVTPLVDCIGAFASTVGGSSLQIYVPSAMELVIHPRTARAWRVILLHLGTALRLRDRLQPDLASSTGREPEAVLSPSGRLHHAEGPATSNRARRRLVDAVKRIEEARGALRRRDPAAALALWEGLIDGRWSLVDRWESDGRRYLVAHANQPGELTDPRALGATERMYLEYHVRGASTAEIAMALGCSAATVGRALSSIKRRFRLSSREELRQLTRAEDLTLERVELGDATVDVLVSDAPKVDPSWTPLLSTAELDVVGGVLTGRTDKEIALARQVALRTVQNQLRSIYRKTGVRRRGDLLGRLRQRP